MGRRPATGMAGALVPVLLLVLLLVPPEATAQALPFHTSTGITAGFDENAGRHFVRIAGRSGLVRDGEPVPDPMDRKVEALAVVNGVILGGITPLWTVRIVVPWVRKTMDFTTPEGRQATYETSGIGDAVVQTKWVFYRDDRPGATTRVGIRGRLKLPVASTDARLPTGEAPPRPLQAGTGSWDLEPTLLFTETDGRWGILANAGWRFNGQDGAYAAGDVFRYDAAVGFRIAPRTYESIRDRSLLAYVEVNGAVSRHDEIAGRGNPDSGGHLVFVSPDLQWVAAPWLLVEGSVQVPVLQRLDGTQLEHETRYHLGVRYRFSVFR